MSRKQYVEIAAIFAGEMACSRDNATAVLTLKRVIYSMADVFKRDNSAFDRQRFYTACGMGEDK